MSTGQGSYTSTIFSPFPLDGHKSKSSERFLLLGHGTPFISPVLEYPVEYESAVLDAGSAPLTDPRAVMQVALRILKQNFEFESAHQCVALPPLVANLGILMKDLSTAADFVFR